MCDHSHEYIHINPIDAKEYSHKLGVACIVLGSVGVLLNLITLIYFTRMKTETENSMYTKIAFLNLVSVDLLLSLVILFIRGPGLAWPDVIWPKVYENETSPWCEAGAVIIWVVSDINILGVLPLTIIFFLLHAPCLRLRKITVFTSIIVCWLVPFADILFIYILKWKKKICVEFKEVYGRCSFEGDGENIMKIENSVVFYMLPFIIHACMWSYIIFFVCRQGNGIYNRQWWKFLKTGLIVLVAFTITWLPYYIVVPFNNLKPTGIFAFVYLFLYSSVIINPIIYGTRSMKFNGKTLAEVISETAEKCSCSRTRTTTETEQQAPRNLVYSSYDDVDGRDAEEMKSEMS